MLTKLIVVHHLIASVALTMNQLNTFFLFCPRYAAQRNLLLTSAARILGETWSSSSAMLGKSISFCLVSNLQIMILTVLYFVKFRRL